MPGRARYTFARRRPSKPGSSSDNAQRLWRALGFPDPPPDARRFTDEDVEVLATLRDVFGDRASSVITARPPTEASMRWCSRSGWSAARSRASPRCRATRCVDALQRGRDSGLTDEQVAELVPESLDWDRISRLLDYVHAAPAARRAVAQVRRRRTATRRGRSSSTVGFVDLVGYTALSQELEEEELVELVEPVRGARLRHRRRARRPGGEDDRRRGDVRDARTPLPPPVSRCA